MKIKHVWEYAGIWGALTNIQALFGYDPESISTDLISGITRDMLIEKMMDCHDITEQQAVSRFTTIALLEFITDIQSKKIDSIDEVLTDWKRSQLRKMQRGATARRSIDPDARADIKSLLLQLQQLTGGY